MLAARLASLLVSSSAAAHLYKPAKLKHAIKRAAARDFSLSVVYSRSPCTPFTTGLTAASALTAERIVTHFDDDLELEVHQDAMDASPLHTVLLADRERVFSVLFGEDRLRERGLV
ncbi:hypothetical protein EV714DRAFT_277688 [Schizophyllum commune]